MAGYALLYQTLPRGSRRLSQPESQYALRCRDAIEIDLRYLPTKTSKSHIKRLRGVSRPQFRLRIGDVRVYYDVTETTVEILAIIPKSEADAWLAKSGERK